MDREQTIETLYKLIQKQHQCKTVDCTGCKKFAQEILSLFTIEGIEMERVCKECGGKCSKNITENQSVVSYPCSACWRDGRATGKQSRPITWGDVEFDKEPWNTIDKLGNPIQKWFWNLKPALIEEGWVIKEGK